MKKLICLILISLALLTNVQAKGKITVYVFTQEGEEISESALAFLKELKSDEVYGNYFNYKKIQIWDKKWNEDYDKRKLADKVASYFDDVITGAPYIVIGDKYKLATFSEDYEEEIIDAIEKAYNNRKYVDLIDKAKKDIKDKRRKDNLAIISITAATIVLIGGFIIIARKNND